MFIFRLILNSTHRAFLLTAAILTLGLLGMAASAQKALSLWNQDGTTGGFTQNTFGPYDGWNATAIADGADGKTRVLWNHADGRASLWNLDSTSGAFTQNTYGPYDGWSAAAVSAGNANVTRVLWTHTDGRMSLWTLLTPQGGLTEHTFGPYPGWTPRTIAEGPDGRTRVLWTHTDGRLSLWSLDNSTNTFTQFSYGPYAGWNATSISVDKANTTHVLWVNTDGRISLWNQNAATGDFTQNTHGPYPGWSARMAADGPDGKTRVLWISTGGRISLWRLESASGTFTQNTYGPYPGWSAAAVSVGASAAHIAWTGSTLEPAPALTTLTAAPDPVSGGTAAAGTVTISRPAPAGGLIVSLSSSSPAATVPATITVPAGAGSAAFSIATTDPGTRATVTLTATLAGSSAVQTTLTVLHPETAPATGVYRLTTRGQQSLALGVVGFGTRSGSPVALAAATHLCSQQWLVEKMADSSYAIHAYSGQNSNQMLDLANGLTTNGNPVATWEDNNNAPQRWLFKSVGDGFYRIIPKNAGMASAQTLDVRNGNNASAGDTLNIYSYYGGENQEFSLLDPGPAQILPSPKKGMGGRQWASGMIHNFWYYTWGGDKPTDAPADVEFVPMEWGYYGGDSTGWLNYVKGQPGVQRILGFNEPDHTDQANLSVAAALDGYQYLAHIGVPIGSPAAADASGSWFSDFMQGAADRGYRVDFITVHCYIRDPYQFLGYIDSIHNRYWDKPMWITEFAPADWSGSNPVSDEEAANFMRIVVPELNRRWYVDRYAWYTGAEHGPWVLGSAALVEPDRSLTPLGWLYSRM